ncbi:MAG: hypothetical protein M3P50_04625 [Actinomycetota bacterium]|nr:hypothetical protein [Actinomycetota bacterium]
MHVALGVLLVVSSAVAGLFGAWCWYRVEPSQAFWTLLRISQAVVVLTALQGGVLVLLGRDADGLHLLYGALPLAISFIAEQLRLAAAQTVLDARGLESASAMRELPDSDQRSIVLQIVRREMGVMAASALVVCVLGLRAAGWL